MTSQPDLIYTSGDNDGLAERTHRAKWLVGMRSNKYAKCHVDFMDADYMRPNWDRHLAMCKEHQPKYAVVPDMSDSIFDVEDIRRALRQADILQQYAQVVYIVPKLAQHIALIPEEYAIGYSVPSSNGAATYNFQRLAGRRLHLLGGSPHFQMRLYREMKEYASFPSVDGNMLQRMAFRAGKYWSGSLYSGGWKEHPEKHTRKPNLALECIEWSLENIRNAWLQKTPPLEVSLFN